MILDNYAKVLKREVGASADDREEAATTVIEVIGNGKLYHCDV